MAICYCCGLKFDQPYVWQDETRFFWSAACPCCGFLFSRYRISLSKNDYSYAKIIDHRESWIIDRKAKWFVEEMRPIDWEPFKQFKNLPLDYRSSLGSLYKRFVLDEFIPNDFNRKL